MRRALAVVATSFLLILGFGVTQADASTGNVVCNSGASRNTLRVDYTSGYVTLGAGRCSASGAQAFRVDVGEHCTSPWGYVYNGPSWLTGLSYYRYVISGNGTRLTLTCNPS